MRILLDENTSHKLKDSLPDYDVVHQEDMGWKGKRNGTLLDLAESAGFDLFVTVDKQLRFQQNPSRRRMSVVTLNVHPTSPSNQLACGPRIAAICERLEESTFYLVDQNSK